MEKKHSFYELSNNDTTFLVIRDPDFKDKNIKLKKKKSNFTLVFDIENLSKKLNLNDIPYFIDQINKNNNILPQNIIIRNCLIEKPSNFFNNLNLDLNLLSISDELYSMSPNLNKLFPGVEAKTLILKKMKINSKLQLDHFLNFILNNKKCEELTLEDIFIELIVKKDEKDDKFSDLEQCITFENGIFYIKDEETNIKKLKMIDCPLFVLTDNTFTDIKNYKDISIDIDENSLLGPEMITKFKIINGYSDLCFDLDSYKLNEENSNDYIEYLEYIFKIICDNNHNFEKLCFKNFDMTKYEYITGENITFINEENWILNDDEKKRKSKFEGFNNEINTKINNNLKKLSNIKQLIFDNCTNYFIDLILKFINYSHFSNKLTTGSESKYDLNYLKIKKCGKEYFDLDNILSLKIKHLILFDTPLTNYHEDTKKRELGNFDNLTIKISSLEHYCIEHNLDYYKTIDIIIKLITNKNFNQNLCFEMNALPIIMTFLIARKFNEEKIPDYFPFFSLPKDDENPMDKDKILHLVQSGIKKRDEAINMSFNLTKLNNKTIILKKNNIKNLLENYEYFFEAYPDKFEHGKNAKEDFGKDIFNIDKDYKRFLEMNKIYHIIFENCLFYNYKNSKVDIKRIENNETIINLIKNTTAKYTFDMASLNEIIFKNTPIDNLTFLFTYFYLENGQSISSEIRDHYLNNINMFFKNLKKIFNTFKDLNNNITIRFKNIKERKEFYCILCLYEILNNKNNYENLKFIYHHKNREKEDLEYKNFPKKEIIKDKLCEYFLKKTNEKNQEVCSFVFDYYYTSEEEEKIFGDFEYKDEPITIEFCGIKFKIEYKFKDEWDIIMK